MIQHLGKNLEKKLLQLYNATWTTGNIPQIWKEAIMIPIYKQGKDKKKPESYRPVSLLSCLGKTMESMVNTRTTWYLEKNSILIEEQAGFRRGRLTKVNDKRNAPLVSAERPALHDKPRSDPRSDRATEVGVATIRPLPHYDGTAPGQSCPRFEAYEIYNRPVASCPEQL
ncbi:Non-LTR (Long terminal repeat) retrotransposon and domain-containing protein [Elysia marginata]|uniref:Non-LTR (Long terminal repeat) retrotransposon and domain-containing protein n=1 Tax=Elysia marginata TaxID=1093978 RepID=A0AAV4FKU5_9GAST|nr:Non-LTR (Long terminal repeat) retrotransposon and domain-containing protein [Elysia marginata]